MKKNLLALAVAGALAAPVVAMADVTIYGQVGASFDYVNNGATSNGVSSNQVSSDASRIGFKGTEDLGGGTSAVWQIESQVNIDGTGNATCGATVNVNNSTNAITSVTSTATATATTVGNNTAYKVACPSTNSNTLGTRNTFVGLSGESWGTALLGRHDSPYKIATRGLDLFADTIADNRSLMGMTGGGATNHDVRATDVLAYISPAMGGVTAAVAYVAGGENPTGTTNSKGSAWSLAGMYNAGPVNASLSYQRVDGSSAATNVTQPIPFVALGKDNKATAWKLGGGYSMDAFAVNAAYERTTSSIAGTDPFGQNNWYVAGKFNVSASDAVKLAYTKAGKVNSVGDTDANQYSVGYDHNLSKRTTVYALYTKLNNKANATYALGLANGMTGGAAGGMDSDPSAWSLGVKHSF